MTNLDSILISKDITLPTKVRLFKAMVFSSGHVWMWELDYKESWAQNWCFWTVALETILESALNCKEIQPVHPKGDQSWIFIERTDAEAEAPILWPPDAKSWLIWKDPDTWERLRAGGEGDDREWDGWMASPTQWTWVWVNSGSWQWTGRPGVLQSMASQRVGHDWATELNPLLVTSFTNIFSQSMCCVLILFMVSFAVQKLFCLIRFHLFKFVFIFISMGDGLKKSCCYLCHRMLCLCFPLIVL